MEPDGRADPFEFRYIHSSTIFDDHKGTPDNPWFSRMCVHIYIGTYMDTGRGRDDSSARLTLRPSTLAPFARRQDGGERCPSSVFARRESNPWKNRRQIESFGYKNERGLLRAALYSIVISLSLLLAEYNTARILHSYGLEHFSNFGPEDSQNAPSPPPPRPPRQRIPRYRPSATPTTMEKEPKKEDEKDLTSYQNYL